MKVHLYKVIKLDDYSNESDLEKMQVMTENDLRREFVWAYDNGRIPHDLICDYQKDSDYNDEYWDDMGNLKAGTMVDILNDICNYTCGDGYYIIETDVNVELSGIEKLEEIQSICIGADSPDAIEHGERDPIEELQCCREDISAISNIVEQIMTTLGD